MAEKKVKEYEFNESKKQWDFLKERQYKDTATESFQKEISELKASNANRLIRIKNQADLKV